MQESVYQALLTGISTPPPQGFGFPAPLDVSVPEGLIKGVNGSIGPTRPGVPGIA
ncbi:MAG: hypothetical protein Q7T11_04485 [Deltaproteobacteria bacterium]|nr:hypothetical protein [Deltaproteobacteria bacterium]